MSKLDDLLQLDDKHPCFNHNDDIDVPKRKIKNLFIELILDAPMVGMDQDLLDRRDLMDALEKL